MAQTGLLQENPQGCQDWYREVEGRVQRGLLQLYYNRERAQARSCCWAALVLLVLGCTPQGTHQASVIQLPKKSCLLPAKGGAKMHASGC